MKNQGLEEMREEKTNYCHYFQDLSPDDFPSPFSHRRV